MTVNITGVTPGVEVDGTGSVVNVTVTTGGGGGGVTVHNLLTGRDAEDAHPIGAITGLQDALDNGGASALADLTDVDVVSDPPTQDDVLAWDDTGGKWTPATLSGGADLSDTTPQALGTAAAGVSTEASRADHVHDMPSAADVGAVASSLIDAKGDLIVGTADNTPARLAAGTDGHVLTLDSAQTAGVKWAAASGGSGTAQVTIVNPFTAGYYITTPHPITVGGTGGGNIATAHNRLVCAPSIVITRTVTIDRLVIVVTNAGDASSVLRLGLWADNGSSRPGTLLAQGTVAGGSTGVKLATVSVTLTPGVYWTGLAWQGGVPTTQPKWQCLNHGAQDMGANFGAVDLSIASRTRVWLYQNSVTGSFSSSPTLTETPAQTAALDVTVPEIALRVAS